MNWTEFYNSLIGSDNPGTLDSLEGVNLKDLNRLSAYIREFHAFAGGISKGDLDIPSPSRENALCWDLKGLRANLQHLTWQAERIAQGDYSQRVEFLGKFSESFNKMTNILRNRDSERLEEITESKLRIREMETLQEALKRVMSTYDDAILIENTKDHSILYQNEAYVQWKNKDSSNGKKIKSQLDNYIPYFGTNWLLRIDDLNSYSVESFPLKWLGEEAICHHIVNVSEQNNRRRKIEEEAYTDPMTGLYNRRFTLKHIEELLANHTQFVLCFIDLDGLKYVNDHFGHNEGDRYLQKTANVILKLFGKHTDAISRFGGDEFVIIIPSCSPTDSRILMEKAQKELEGMDTIHEYTMHMSYGQEEAVAGDIRSVDEIISTADSRMYEYKKLHKASRSE